MVRAAMAMAVGVRADSWQREVPRRTRVRARPPPGERGQGVGAVGLGRPHRVEAEPLGLVHQVGGVGRRPGSPVPELQSELHVPLATWTSCLGRPGPQAQLGHDLLGEPLAGADPRRQDLHRGRPRCPGGTHIHGAQTMSVTPASSKRRYRSTSGRSASER